jgi:hypothetical protein
MASVLRRILLVVVVHVSLGSLQVQFQRSLRTPGSLVWRTGGLAEVRKDYELRRAVEVVGPLHW